MCVLYVHVHVSGYMHICRVHFEGGGFWSPLDLVYSPLGFGFSMSSIKLTLNYMYSRHQKKVTRLLSSQHTGASTVPPSLSQQFLQHFYNVLIMFIGTTCDKTLLLQRFYLLALYMWPVHIYASPVVLIVLSS